MQSKVVKVRRNAWINPYFWYASKRGQLFEVIMEDGAFYYVNNPEDDSHPYAIYKEDIESVVEVQIEPGR